MRRSEFEITNSEELEEIIRRCEVVRIGIAVDNIPYIVPLNFGYKDGYFYFHGAKEGRKIDMLRKNPKVCFEMDTDHVLRGDTDIACDWTMKYTSIIGTGIISFVEDPEGKMEALNILMQQYGGKSEYAYSERMIERIGIMKLKISEMTGKSR